MFFSSEKLETAGDTNMICTVIVYYQIMYTDIELRHDNKAPPSNFINDVIFECDDESTEGLSVFNESDDLDNN
ncbi:unnamed protein product [Brachionus calyciflorus]|uniref:Uncharacterized protein n=1 Tax=Brachionus calyciflorus TaxID=104777 RepID=A0A813SPK1_9BILA|nr:unnamed protein product [Brachionus calyciflorus]